MPKFKECLIQGLSRSLRSFIGVQSFANYRQIRNYHDHKKCTGGASEQFACKPVGGRTFD